jgi:hypothetical protein
VGGYCCMFRTRRRSVCINPSCRSMVSIKRPNRGDELERTGQTKLAAVEPLAHSGELASRDLRCQRRTRWAEHSDQRPGSQKTFNGWKYRRPSEPRASPLIALKWWSA